VRPSARFVPAALLAACALAAAAAPAGAETSVDFPHQGNTARPFTVPPGVYWLTIDAEGAPGGSENDIAPAGHGGAITATVPVEPGQELMVYSAEYGYGSDGGWGWARGGRHGIISEGGAGHDGGGGGGASAVVAPNGSPLVVAGGGGGGGGDGGGGLDDAWGGRGGAGGSPAERGSAARRSQGSDDGRPGCAACQQGSAGTHGGDEDRGGGGGGGGGGGYHGGGGGGDGGDSTGGGGGGGGSNYYVPGALAVRNGTGSGHDGDVVLSWGAAPTQATIVSGDNQRATVGGAFEPLRVKLTTAAGVPAAGAPVIFQVPVEAPTGSFSNRGTTFETHADSQGIATAGTLRAGGTAGRFAVKAFDPQAKAAAVRFEVENAAAATATAITTSSDPATVGEALRFTADVATSSPDPELPATGAVQFWDGVVPIGSPVGTDETGRATSPAVSNLPVGASQIRAEYLGDDATEPSEATLRQEVVKARSAVAVTSSANPAEVGEPLIFTAHVSAHAGDAAPPPTGTVTFTIDGTAGTPVPLAGGEAASAPVGTLSAGAHEVTATYSGDADHEAAAGALSQAVGPGATAVSVASSTSPSFYGEPTELRATVTQAGAGATPTGRIVFLLGADPLCPAAELEGGTAACDITAKLDPGPHRINVDFQGSGGFADSTGTMVQQVAPARTATAAAVDPEAVPFGDQSWLRSSVAALAPGTGQPRGSVQFYVDGEAVGGPIALTEGSAETLPFCTLDNPVCSLSPGVHRVEAQYGGGEAGRYAPSRGASAASVLDARTTTVLGSEAGAEAPFEASTRFIAKVDAPVGAGPAAGGVGFLVDGTPLGDPVGLREGKAVSEAVTLPPGDHDVVARYEGAAGFMPSEATFTQAVALPAPPAPGDGGAGGGSTATPGGGAAGARATLRGSSATVDRWGRVRVRVACHGPAGTSCAGRLTLRNRVVLALRRYSVPAGAVRPVALELDNAGRALLSRHARLRARIKLAAPGESQAQALTLRATRAPAIAIGPEPELSPRRDVLRLTLRCAGAARCRASLALAARGRRLGTWERTVAGGRAVALRLRVPPAATAWLRAHRTVALRLAALSTIPVGIPGVDRRRLVVEEAAEP
jgi:hypothetical protein